MLQPQDKRYQRTLYANQALFGQRNEHAQRCGRGEELPTRPSTLRNLELELENLKKLQCFLASEARELLTKRDADALAHRLFMSKFEPGP